MKLLSEAAIKTLAGESAYQRGLSYYNEGRVSPIEIRQGIISAQIEGTKTYQIQLRHTAKVFEGSCNCPASDNFDFCKHCVAVALSYYYETQCNQELDKTPNTDILAHHLGTLTKPKLVDELYSVIVQDKQLHELWLLRAELATGQLDAKDIRKQITKALPFRPSGLWRFNQVALYFKDAEQRIRALCSAIAQLPAAKSLKLLLYAFERLEKTLETVDDSGGYRFSLLAVLEKEFMSSFDSNEIDSQQRTTLLAGLFTNEKYTYQLIRENISIEKKLTPQEQQELIKELTDFWNTLTPPDKDDFYRDTPFLRVEKYLVAHAQANKQAGLEIEILTKGAVTVARCLELVDRCLELKELKEAKKWLRYASQFDKLRVSDISAIEHGQVKLWLSEGDYDSALQAQWAVFLEDESLASILDLATSAQMISARAEWIEKCIRHLQGRLAKDQQNTRHLERCETLVALFLNEGRQKEAATLASSNKLKPGTLMAIVNHANSLSKTEVKLAEQACNYLIAFGSHDTNARAIAFLNKIRECFTKDQQAFTNLVNTIYQRPENKRKINFTKELKSEFADFINSPQS